MNMDMSSMSNMDMTSMGGMVSATATATKLTSSMSISGAMASSAASTAAAMSGMDMGGSGSMPKCKISMLWNWNVIDSCFLAETWHITSRGMFGGSCVGIVCLAIALEFLRRLNREYDRYLLRTWEARHKHEENLHTANDEKKPGITTRFNIGLSTSSFSLTFIQIIIRAVIYAVIVGVSYILMLLAMYFNGYIIFSIIIGSLIGYAFFGTDQVTDRTIRESGSCCC